MNVSLTPELECLVHEKVASGRYNSASEVVREGLRLLENSDRFRELQLSELRADIEKGMDDLRQGRTEPLDPAAIKAEGRRRRKAKSP